MTDLALIDPGLGAFVQRRVSMADQPAGGPGSPRLCRRKRAVKSSNPICRPCVTLRDQLGKRCKSLILNKD
jgi:hypothetical protein